MCSSRVRVADLFAVHCGIEWRTETVQYDTACARDLRFLQHLLYSSNTYAQKEYYCVTQGLLFIVMIGGD